MNKKPYQEKTTTSGDSSLATRPYLSLSGEKLRFENLLSVTEQEELERIAELASYKKNEKIFSKGEPSEYLFIVSKGIAQISEYMEDGQRQILAFFRPGDLLGLSEEGRYSNTAIALTPVLLFRLPSKKMRDLLLTDSRLQLHILVKVTHELRTAQRKLIVLTRMNPTCRLASFVLEFSKHKDFIDAENSAVYLPMLREDIADYLGIRRETLARSITDLEKMRVIKRLSRHKIQILDFEALANLGRV